MELIFIRHADARSGASHSDDSMRALSDKGRQVHEQVARELHRRGFNPDVILSSPRLRAEQTAWITAQVLPGDVPVIEVQELDGGYTVEDLLRRLQSYIDCASITCVGHEPDMTFWTNRLLHGQAREVAGFSTSGVASLGFDRTPLQEQGRLNYFYTADDLLLR